MTVVRSKQEDFGAVFEAVGERELPAHYGKPERTHAAVRRIAGVTELHYGVVEVRGEDRVAFVDNAVTNAVPRADGEGRYALLLDPDGRVRTDMYVFAAGERLLLFVPPGEAGPLVEEWAAKTFVQDVDLDAVTGEFGVFGVHGPKATEKVASVLGGPGAPDDPLTFVRGRVRESGVTVVRGDGLAGEEGYDVVCAADDAAEVFDALVTHGLNAVPFGRETWDTLTLEAGTPRFETELDGALPNEAGVRNALDFEKGCYVGQEVVSRVENRGRPPRRLVGLAPAALPERGATVFADGEAVGEVTRAAACPSVGAARALAYVDFEADPDGVAVGDEAVSAPAVELPFVEGSQRSARLPTYERS